MEEEKKSGLWFELSAILKYSIGYCVIKSPNIGTFPENLAGYWARPGEVNGGWRERRRVAPP